MVEFNLSRSKKAKNTALNSLGQESTRSASLEAALVETKHSLARTQEELLARAILDDPEFLESHFRCSVGCRPLERELQQTGVDFRGSVCRAGVQLKAYNVLLKLLSAFGLLPTVVTQKNIFSISSSNAMTTMIPWMRQLLIFLPLPPPKLSSLLVWALCLFPLVFCNLSYLNEYRLTFAAILFACSIFFFFISDYSPLVASQLPLRWGSHYRTSEILAKVGGFFGTLI